MKEEYNTIIIGAGISGLGCANKLLDNNVAFKIISPEIGGRIAESYNHTVEYGAYYIMDIYHNTSQFFKKGRRIKPSRLVFHDFRYSYSLFDRRLLTHSFQFIKLIFILKKFKSHYEQFKKKCVYSSQISCLKSDPYLWKLYTQNAYSFIRFNKIKDLVDQYVAQVLYGTTFTSIKNLNAFEFLHFSLPLIVPVYEFVFKKEQLMTHIKKYWVKDKVLHIKQRKNKYLLITEKGKKFFCENVVLATPPSISKKLLKLKQLLRDPVAAHMFHIEGKIKPSWNYGEDNLFAHNNSLFAIAHQGDNSYLFYTKKAKPCFKKYFFDYRVIKHKYWNPAFNIGGSNLLEFIQGRNLYVIGDNNICGLEDSYIYGVYAANKILGKTLD